MCSFFMMVRIISVCADGCVQIYDNLNLTLTLSSRKTIGSLHKLISFLPVQRQPHNINCRLFGILFAAEIIDRKSPSQAVVGMDLMRKHFMSCTKKTNPFPKASIWLAVSLPPVDPLVPSSCTPCVGSHWGSTRIIWKKLCFVFRFWKQSGT